MLLNELRLEGTIHTEPKRARDRGKVEFILCQDSLERGGVRFFPVEMWESLARHFGAREGKRVLVIGDLEQRESLDPRTAEVRLRLVIRALELRELKEHRGARANRSDGVSVSHEETLF